MIVKETNLVHLDVAIIHIFLFTVVIVVEYYVRR